VGHHYGRTSTDTPWEQDGITCLDTGCGKGDEQPLTAAEIDVTTGQVIALHTF
jgi:ubiquinone/menaquinone biosynthesis C-methylase UbiE